MTQSRNAVRLGYKIRCRRREKAPLPPTVGSGFEMAGSLSGVSTKRALPRQRAVIPYTASQDQETMNAPAEMVAPVRMDWADLSLAFSCR